jgi:hypothetical protein
LCARGLLSRSLIRDIDAPDQMETSGLNLPTAEVAIHDDIYNTKFNLTDVCSIYDLLPHSLINVKQGWQKN